MSLCASTARPAWLRRSGVPIATRCLARILPYLLNLAAHTGDSMMEYPQAGLGLTPSWDASRPAVTTVQRARYRQDCGQPRDWTFTVPSGFCDLASKRTPEVDDVAVFHYVILAFETLMMLCLCLFQ